MELDFTAPDHVHKAIAALGRTEDVRFSPDNRRLAVLSFLKHTLTIFDVSNLYPGHIVLTDVVELSSNYLKYPHGIEFINSSTILVANRGSQEGTFSQCGTGEIDSGFIAVF